MKVIGTFFNATYQIEEVVNLIAPNIEAVKIFMDTELNHFRKFYEDIPYEKWNKGSMVDFYTTNEYYDYYVDCKYCIVVVFDESEFDSSNAIELNSEGGRV